VTLGEDGYKVKTFQMRLEMNIWQKMTFLLRATVTLIVTKKMMSLTQTAQSWLTLHIT